MNAKELKFDLCCAARLLFRFGLSVGNAGHLSITVGENRMLVNRFGPSFATMTPADVKKLVQTVTSGIRPYSRGAGATRCRERFMSSFITPAAFFRIVSANIR